MWCIITGLNVTATECSTTSFCAFDVPDALSAEYELMNENADDECEPVKLLSVSHVDLEPKNVLPDLFM